jgi:PAS domain S-box-containing protein
VDYAIFMLDAEGRVASWNAGAQRISGYELHEIVGQHFSRFYPREDVERKKPQWELEVAAPRAASRRKAGACARTARPTGPT